jgi:hypothetical protein
MKKIFIDEDQVTTLAQLAKDLSGTYGWKSYEVEGNEIRFETDDGAKHRVDTSGFAQTLEDGEWVDDDELNVNWDEDFDRWSNHVWAEDEDGNTVMLHD